MVKLLGSLQVESTIWGAQSPQPSWLPEDWGVPFFNFCVKHLWHILWGTLLYTMCVCMLRCFSPVRLFETPWTIAHQAPLSMRFFRQEYWSGLPCPPLGDLPNPGIEPASLKSPALRGRFFTTNTAWSGSLSFLLLMRVIWCQSAHQYKVLLNYRTFK